MRNLTFLIAILFPIIAGTVVSVVKMPDGHTRNRLYAAVTILTDVLAVCALLYGKPVTLFKLAEGVTISFSPDPIGKYILAVVLILYTAVVFYAFEYMEHEERQNVFFAFLLISFGALMAVCVSGNLVTLYLSFETLTLTTFPLVLHEMDRAAVAAGLKYLFYSVGGALLGLCFSLYFLCTLTRPGMRHLHTEDFSIPRKWRGMRAFFSRQCSRESWDSAPKPVCTRCMGGCRRPIRSRPRLLRLFCPRSSRRPVWSV